MMKAKRCISVIVSAVLTGTLLTGCSMTDKLMSMVEDNVDITATISKNSKWLNSDILGAVTEDTQVSEKDDFSTAVNKDWILSMQDKVQKQDNVSRLDNNNEVITEQKQKLLKTAAAGEDFGENQIGMDEKDYKHISEIFTRFTEMASDWEERNQEGAKPLEKYIKEISEIDSLEKMSSYLCNEDGSFFSQSYLIPFGVTAPLDDSGKYTVAITSSFDTSLQANSDVNTSLQEVYIMEMVTDVLKELGYSAGDAKKIVKRCWQLETALSECTASEALSGNVNDVEAVFNNKYTKDEIKDLAGDYPLVDTLKTYNYDNAAQYVVYEPLYVEGVAKIYKEKNLEKLKSYYIVHTILDAMPLLTREYYDQYMTWSTGAENQNQDEDQDDTTEIPDQDPESEQEKSLENLPEEDQILQRTVMTYMNEIFEEMYVANYCSTEEKVYLQNIIKDAIRVYEKMLGNEDWLTEGTQQKAIEKLNNITTHVLYPNEMNGYEGMELDGDNLLDAVAQLNVYSKKKDAEKIDTKVNKADWNLAEMPTTVVNAYYNSDNSIIILAGVAADKESFDVNASYEENLGHIGFIIGHEISHAFDTNGYQYDKDGNINKWWTEQDEQKFQARAGRLAEYFSTFACMRDGNNVNGDMVEGEAIADMGGVKCMLALGKEQPDFDYQKFFRAYAQTFAASRKLSKELLLVTKDSHPLAFLRTNVTVQQFEEFYEAFDIQPGDGMYLAPEKRVAVW